MSDTALLVLAAIAPALVLLVVLAYTRQGQRFDLVRPPLFILAGLGAGVGSAYLALVVETGLMVLPWAMGSLGGLALFTFFAVGLAEEGAKYVCVRALWRLKTFTEVYDGVLLAGAVGLGFGATENIFYVLDQGYETALVRAFTAVPLHGMLGVVLGYYLGLAKIAELEHNKVQWGLMFTGLTWAVVGHGFYDFLAFQTNPIAEALLWTCLVVIGWICWRLIVTARQLSPTWGGTGPQPPRVFIPPVLQARNPVVAGLVGLVPGVGQMYNGEWQKGFSLMGVGVVNVLALVSVFLIVTFPLQTIFLLLSWGLTLGDKPDKFLITLSETPVLVVLGAIFVTFCLFGAYDAYRTALSRQFEYRVAPPLRVKSVQAVSLAYAGHLLLVFLVALVPIFMQQPSGGGGQPISFDLVESPTTLNGHKEVKEGTKEGTSKTNKRKQVAQSVKTPVKSKLGTTPVPRPKEAVAAQQAKGIPRSYSDFLSWKIRQYHDLYFAQVNPDEYTVVRYVIEPDGRIATAEVMVEHSTTPPAIGELAAETIRDMDPLDPLPPGTNTIEVLELFWNGTPIAKPGSLEERLSTLPDGRWVQEIKP